MNASSGGSWRGGKKSNPSRSQSPASTPSNRGWKSTKKSPATQRRGNSKKLTQFFGVGTALLLLLAIAIWIFWPDYQLHTHFVVINPLQGSTRYPYEAKINFPASNVEDVGRFAAGKHSISESQSVKFVSEEELQSGATPLADAHVCLIYYRAVTIPGKDQDHLVLLKNSTADPESPNEHESLTSLKSQIELLPKNLKVILLVDVNSIESDWRTGYFGDSTHREFMKWADEIPNLITILSCDVGERSWTTGLPGWGGTVFEMALEKALSKQADQSAAGGQNGDDALSLTEFYESLAETTQQWVVANRSKSGQHVKIYPPLEQIANLENGQPLLIMKRLPEAPDRQPDTNTTKDIARDLSPLWNRLASDAAAQAGVTVPVLVGAVQSQIQNAEATLSAGRDDISRQFLSRADENFTDASQVLADRGDQQEIMLSKLDSLLEHSEIKAWFEAAHLKGIENPNLSGPSASSILAENLNQYPFAETSVSKPAAQALDRIQQTRERVEKTAALMFHDARQFQTVLKQMHRDLLALEDLLFLNSSLFPPSFSVPDRMSTLSRIEASADEIERYVLLKIETELFQARLFQQLPEIVNWGAGTSNSPFSTQLLATLQNGEPVLAPGRLTQTEELQIETANTLLAAEDLLKTYLLQIEIQFDENGGIGQAYQELRDRLNLCRSHWEKVQGLLPQVENAIPGNPVVRWQESQNAIRLPYFENQARNSFLEGAGLPWSQGVPQPAGSSSSPSSDPPAETQFLQYRDGLVWDSAWRLRLQNLMQLTLPGTPAEHSKKIQALWDDWEILQKAETAETVHSQLYEIGSKLRAHWTACRNQIANALAYRGSDLTEYGQRLRKADLSARFLRGDDVDLWQSQRKLTSSLEQVQQFEYCLCLVDHLLQSQWVLPTEKPAPNAEKWFVQQGDAWLTRAQALTQSNPSLSAAQELVESKSLALQSADQWVEKLAVKIPGLSTFEEQQQQINFTSQLNFTGQRPESGIASFSLLGAGPQGGIPAVLELPNNAVPVQLNADQFSSEMTITRKSIPEKCSAISLRPQLFFRGRTMIRPPMTVDPCPSTQRTWQYLAGRESAEFQVRGNDNRPIMFVLDWSYSMNEMNANNKPKQRHIAAVSAVEMIIEEMPATMRVGLVIFGHSSKQDRNGKLLLNQGYADAFKEFLEVKVKDPLEDVDIIHPIGLLETDREVIKYKLNRLKNVEPYSTTPLGLAMTTAAVELARAGKTGGIAVAITDGAPTDLGDPLNGLLNPTPATIQARTELVARRYAQLQRALSPTDISAVLFALDFGEKDLTALNCLFAATPSADTDPKDCEFMGSNAPLSVPIIRATGEGDASGRNLRKVIDAQIEPRNFEILLKNGEPVATQPLKDAKIIVAPNETYQVRFGDVALNNLRMTNGDVLSLEMNWSKGRFDVKREFTSHKAASVKTNSKEQLDDPVTLRVNNLRKPSIDANAELYDAIEVDVMLDHGKEFRPVQRPEEIWFTFSAVGDPQFQPTAVRQEFTSRFGAPGWSFKLSPWPRTLPLSVNAFWKMQRTTPDQILPFTDLAAATSRESAVVLGGAGKNFPSLKIWQKQREEAGRQIVEIRLEPSEKQDFASLVNLTVELGETSILNQNDSFRPDFGDHLKTVVDSGVVVHAFVPPQEKLDLAHKVIAMTSLAARQKGAFQLEAPIQVHD